ncbi:unnamed protein product [Trichogramma brassicae]|uniref:Uncharacterized protein n=1 Tax=Trichogramma brassicae TaxID=86971 RepID=A0A6H5I834_9HYME|nr:unnamed protein product [Trichogramma brassicae]
MDLAQTFSGDSGQLENMPYYHDLKIYCSKLVKVYNIYCIRKSSCEYSGACTSSTAATSSQTAAKQQPSSSRDHQYDSHYQRHHHDHLPTRAVLRPKTISVNTFTHNSQQMFFFKKLPCRVSYTVILIAIIPKLYSGSNRDYVEIIPWFKSRLYRGYIVVIPGFQSRLCHGFNRDYDAAIIAILIIVITMRPIITILIIVIMMPLQSRF